MIEPPAVEGPTHDVVEQVAFIEDVGRVVSFRLAPGGAVPENRSTQVLLVALTDLTIDVGVHSRDAVRISLRAGQAQLLSTGVTGLANAGADEARFTLIDLPNTD